MKQLDPLVDFDDLYASCGTQLFRFCFRLMGDRQEAEDLMQDVFIAAFQGRERFRGDSNVRTWLWRIALFKAKDRLKRLRRARWFRREGITSMRSVDSRLAIEQALDRLPDRLKRAFILTKMEELSIAEAAAILRLPEGTVKYHVYEATIQLRAALGDSEIALAISSEEIANYAM